MAIVTADDWITELELSKFQKDYIRERIEDLANIQQ